MFPLKNFQISSRKILALISTLIVMVQLMIDNAESSSSSSIWKPSFPPANLTMLTFSPDSTNPINYTDHSIVRIPLRDFHRLFKTSDGEQDNHEHEILWYDQSDRNSTYAIVRVGPKTIGRVKRDLHAIRERPVYFTNDLQSWINFERDRSNPYMRNNNQNQFDLSEAESEDEMEDEAILAPHQESAISSTFGERHSPRHSEIVPSFVLNQYHPLDKVYQFMKDIEAVVPGVTVFTLGYSHENRPILALEILNNPNDNRFIWIDGCTHAREWVTVTTALYIIERAVVEKVPLNFIVAPVLNVDGYVYTWVKDRMWRKNRRPYFSSRTARNAAPARCTGVDLNRNYDINFGGTGSSDNPCSFLYQGPKPFSEPEVRAARDLLAKNSHKIKMTLSLHSFNQLWSCPNAFTTAITPDHNHHMSVLKSVQSAVFRTTGMHYDIGPLGSSLYLGSGFMMDWIYHRLGIRDAYLVELRDRGFFGFILPVDQIWPTATETWQGVRAAIKHIFHV